MSERSEQRIGRLLWALEQENRRLLALLREGWDLAAAEGILAAEGAFHSRAGCGYDRGRRSFRLERAPDERTPETVQKGCRLFVCTGPFPDARIAPAPPRGDAAGDAQQQGRGQQRRGPHS